MKKMIAIVAIVSILETLVCGFSFWLLIAFVARALFVGKLVGMKISLGLLIGLEIAALGSYVLFPVLFSGDITLSRFLMFVFCAAASIAIEWYDDYMYVYVEEEDN